MKLPIINNQVALTSDADDLSDVFLGGVRYENSATPKVRATTVSGQYQANGLSFDATGRVFYTDATAGLPAGTTFAGGLPFSPSGALCVSSGSVSTWGNGIPFAANGAVSALFVSGLTFGVTLSSVVGGLPASGTGIVTINQAVGEITPVITVSRSTGVAPLAVTFDALGTSAPAYTSLPFSEIYYAWTFGDPAGGATWSYGTRPGVNSKNEAIGPVAAHVFETHSATPYTVTCWAFYLDSGGTLHSGSSTTSITVTNPDTVFAANTIYISQNSTPVPGENDVPPGATVQQVPLWITVQTLAQTYKRILLKRGDTWSVVPSSTVTFGASQAGAGIIGAYGSGAKPIIQTDTETPLRLNADANDWRLVDLTVTSTDLVTSTGGGVVVFNALNTLLLRTDVNRCGRLVLEAQGVNGYYVVDSVIGPASVNGTASINLYGANSDRIGILGSRFTGGRDHGIRIGGTATSVLSNLRIDGGRTGSHTITIRGKGDVPTPWNGLWTEHVVVSDNAMEGVVDGIAALALKPTNADFAERLRRVIVERNRIDAPNSEAIFAQVSEELTIRNNILTTGYGIAISIGAVSNVGSPLPSSGWVYNNTIYKSNIIYSTSFSSAFLVSGVTGYDIKNNIAYAPGSTSPTMFGGSGVEGVNYTQSNNSSNAQILSTLPFVNATPVVATDFAPAGYAVNGGAWVPVYKNYFGTTNSNPREIGAI